MKRIKINKLETLIHRVILSLGMFLSLASCAKKENYQKESIKLSAPETITYQTEQIDVLQPHYSISIPGELKPSEQVDLYAKVESFVKKLHVDIGDRVKKGQLLAVLEAPELNQKYLSDQSTEQRLYSDYQYAKQNYERLQEAAKTEGAVASLELERAKSRMHSSHSAYNASKAQTTHSQQIKDYLSIFAAFDGVVTERNVSEGALVGPSSGQPIFKLAQESHLKLRVAVPEKHIASIPDDMEISFKVSSQPGKKFDAKLSRSSRIIQSEDRAITLEFDVENNIYQLSGGEYAQVELNLQRKTPTFWVTNKNILDTQSGSFVWILNNNELYKIPVKKGLRIEDKIEVFGDLNEESYVVQNPTDHMKEGLIK